MIPDLGVSMEERPYGARWSFDEDPGQPQPPPPRRNRSRAPWWQRRGAQLGAGAVVLAGAGVGVGLALGSHDSNATPSQVHVWGSLTIAGFNFTDTENPTNSFDGDTCTTTGGYDDISAGAAVVIGGPTGQIGVGALGAGTISNGTCSFDFDVPVPSGLSVYTVTISHRGTQSFTPDQLAGGVRLSLGN